MFRFIILIILGYFVFRIFRSMFMPKPDSEKVKSKESPPSKKKTINNKKIEDADFEEIE